MNNDSGGILYRSMDLRPSSCEVRESPSTIMSTLNQAWGSKLCLGSNGLLHLELCSCVLVQVRVACLRRVSTDLVTEEVSAVHRGVSCLARYDVLADGNEVCPRLPDRQHGGDDGSHEAPDHRDDHLHNRGGQKSCLD